jgi:WhiB family redox-sensing transcriptional regulator
MGNRFKADWEKMLRQDAAWMDHAACLEVSDPDIFFPNFGGMSDRARREAIELAQEFCNICPVRTACERHSEKFSNGWGIWGEYVYDRSLRRNSA